MSAARSVRSVLVTGVAGFIGFHVALKLLKQGIRVIGLDSLTPYYSPLLKTARLAELSKLDADFSFAAVDISQFANLAGALRNDKPDVCIHLAAQAGVRFSLESPFTYGESNLVGFLTVLEYCRQTAIPHLVYASSSSVYGQREDVPFTETSDTSHPSSLYAATKKANEVMAYSYSHCFGMRTTGLRFFTVYGPWGRPDMAYYSFAARMRSGQPIHVYGDGSSRRDYTFVDDAVESVWRIAIQEPTEEMAQSSKLARVYNIGNARPYSVIDLIRCLELSLGVTAVRHNIEQPRADVYETFADTHALMRDYGFTPNTVLEVGISQFAKWYDGYSEA